MWDGFAERDFVSSLLLPPRPTSCNLADKNYRTPVATLVNQLGVTAISVYLGNMTLAFRSTTSAMTLLSAIGLMASPYITHTLSAATGRPLYFLPPPRSARPLFLS